MEGNKQKTEISEIDIAALFYKLYLNRKKIYKAIGIGIVAGVVIGFSQPKKYKVEVSLSPESRISGAS